MLLADADAEKQASLSIPPNLGCAVHVLADVDYEVNFMPLSVSVDDDLRGWLTHERGYYLLPLDSGTHTLVADRNCRHCVHSTASVDFACHDGDILFAKIVGKTPFWFGKKTLEIVFEGRDQGQADVAERQLALTAGRAILTEESK